MYKRLNMPRCAACVILLLAIAGPGLGCQTAASVPPAPAATSTPTPAAVPIAAATPTPTPTPVPTPFSIVWLSDTQMMSFRRPDALALMGQWIADHRVERNILQVVQTGDAVEHGGSALQWEAFDGCYNRFKDDIPYFAICGNHEPGVRDKDVSLFLSRPYIAALPDEQKTLGGMAAYTTFTAGGERFLLLGAGWGAEDAALSWMDGVLTRYADHTAILLFHAFLTPQGEMFDRYQPLYDTLVAGHANVRMVLCGHEVGRAHRIDLFDDDGDGDTDRSVSIQLMNYQDLSDRCGQLRIFTFDPVARTIAITTYSPVTECYYRDGTHAEDIYVMENAF